MRNNLTRHYIDLCKGLEPMEHLKRTIGCSTAPTIMGIKPSSLITLTQRGETFDSLWEQLTKEISRERSLKIWEFRRTPNHRLVLFYNPTALKEVMERPEAACCLRGFGYRLNMDVPECLNLLRQRMTVGFPHEIGILLGIPSEDVMGFIKNKGRNYLISGYWKVYHNPQRALKTFQDYDQAKRRMMDLFSRGGDLLDFLCEQQPPNLPSGFT